MFTTITAVRASIPDATRIAWEKTGRRLLHLRLSLTGASGEQKRKLERRLRGREQYHKLQQADAVVVSFGKSGRTWLRVMMSRLYQQKYQLPDRAVIGFGNFHRMATTIPKIFFTHDNYIADYTGHADSKVDFYGKKVVLMVRDPRDVAISQFFQWKYRMRPHKKSLNHYPEHDADVSIYDFIAHKANGIPGVVNFMNVWAREIPNLENVLVVRYEDLRSDPHKVLQRLADFLEIPSTQTDIEDAVDFASYDNMKKLEGSNGFLLGGGRLMPKDRNNPDSFKVRRAKVGGYRDYLEDDQIEHIDRLVNETLDPIFEYSSQRDS